MTWTDRCRRACLALLVVTGGCWPPESTPPAAFDCRTIDRAEERFPEECSDAGVPADADTADAATADASDDAAP